MAGVMTSQELHTGVDQVHRRGQRSRLSALGQKSREGMVCGGAQLGDAEAHEGDRGGCLAAYHAAFREACPLLPLQPVPLPLPHCLPCCLPHCCPAPCSLPPLQPEHVKLLEQLPYTLRLPDYGIIIVSALAVHVSQRQQ